MQSPTWRRRAMARAAGATLMLTASALPRAASAAPDFTMLRVDRATAGDIKMLADVDGDGRLDPMVGGSKREGLNWYRFGSLQRTRIATPVVQFTTDGEAGDINRDGAPDIVVADGNRQNNLVWFENPRPGGNPYAARQWVRRTIGTIGGWGKDIELADYDGDGRLDAAVRTTQSISIFFNRSGAGWRKSTISGVATGEGMARADLDRDGDMDLIVRGAWLRNPGGERARLGGWTGHRIGNAPVSFKAVAADLDGDGRLEVVFSSSEGTADVTVWRMRGNNPYQGWTSRVVMRRVDRAHTLQAADMDGDGDRDLVVGQMHTSALKRIMLVENRDGAGRQWIVRTVDGGGIHNGIVADINRDGRPDIFGANWTGNPPVRLWLNRG